MNEHETISFTLGGINFEYDKVKEQINIEKHGISFRTAARVFFDYNYIEDTDDDNVDGEQRYDVIGDASVAGGTTAIGDIGGFLDDTRDILYVVYTERIKKITDGGEEAVIRLISARLANEFERGLYYGKF